VISSPTSPGRTVRAWTTRWPQEASEPQTSAKPPTPGTATRGIERGKCATFRSFEYLHPKCRARDKVPLVLLLGGDDRWNHASICPRSLAASEAWKAYPDADPLLCEPPRSRAKGISIWHRAPSGASTWSTVPPSS